MDLSVAEQRNSMKRVGIALVVACFVAIPFVPTTGTWFAILFVPMLLGASLVVIGGSRV